MESSNDPPKISKLLKYGLCLVLFVIVLIAINYHLQQPLLVYGGGAVATAVVLSHLALVGVIVTAIKRRFGGKAE